MPTISLTRLSDKTLAKYLELERDRRLEVVDRFPLSPELYEEWVVSNEEFYKKGSRTAYILTAAFKYWDMPYYYWHLDYVVLADDGQRYVVCWKQGGTEFTNLSEALQYAMQKARELTENA